MPLWRCFVEVILVQNKVMLIKYRWLSQIICVGQGQSEYLNRVETSLEKKVHPWTTVSTHLQESLACPPWGLPCRFWTLVTNPHKCTSQFLKHISKFVFLQLALILYLFPDWCSHKTHEVSPRLVCPQLLEPQPSSSSSLQHIKEQEQYAAIKHVVCLNACFMNQAKITKQVSIYISLQFLIMIKTTPASPLPSHLVPGMDAILSPWDVVRKEGPREHLPGLMLDHTSTMSQNQSLRQVGICFSPSRGQRHEVSCPSRVLSIAPHSCHPRSGPQGRNLTTRDAVLSQKKWGLPWSQRPHTLLSSLPSAGLAHRPRVPAASSHSHVRESTGTLQRHVKGATSTQSSWSSNCPLLLEHSWRSRLSSEPLISML